MSEENLISINDVVEVEKLKEAHEEAKQLIAKRKTKLKEARV